MLNFVFNFQPYNDLPLNLTGNPKICRTTGGLAKFCLCNASLGIAISGHREHSQTQRQIV